jgi:hypothetical protein
MLALPYVVESPMVSGCTMFHMLLKNRIAFGTPINDQLTWLWRSAVT